MPSSQISSITSDLISIFVKFRAAISPDGPNTGQVLTIEAVGASGTWSAEIDGFSYGPIPACSKAATVQTALNAHTFTYSVSGGPYRYRVTRSDGGAIVASIDGSGLSGSFARGTSLAVTDAGNVAALNGYLATTRNVIVLPGMLRPSDEIGGVTGRWVAGDGTSGDQWPARIGGGAGTGYIEGPASSLSKFFPGELRFGDGSLPAGFYDFRFIFNPSATVDVPSISYTGGSTIPATDAQVVIIDGDDGVAGWGARDGFGLNMQLASDTILPGTDGWRTISRSAWIGTGTARVVFPNDGNDGGGGGSVVVDRIEVVPVPPSSATNTIYIDDLSQTLQAGPVSKVGPYWSFLTSDGHSYGHTLSYSNNDGTTPTSFSWIFRGVPAGAHDYFASLAGFGFLTTSATYAVFEGTSGTPTTTFMSVDQTATPSGGSSFGDPNGTGDVFKYLGSATTSDPTVRLVMTTWTTGDLAGADAAAMIATGATPPFGTPIAPTPLSVSSSVTSAGGPPTITVGGVVQTLVGGGYSPNNPNLIYALSTPIPPGSTVTFSAPDSWLQTSAGLEPVTTAMGVSLLSASASGLRTYIGNVVGSTFNPSTLKTLQLGYHASVMGDTLPTLVYSDLMKQSNTWNTGAVAVDSDGWPTAAGVQGFVQVTGPPPAFIDDKGIPNVPFVTYTVKWNAPGGTFADVPGGARGDGSCALTSGADDGVSFVFDGANYSSSPTTGNIRQYTYSAGSNRAPTMNCVAVGHCKDIEIFRDGVPHDGSAPLFDNQYVSQLKGALTLRTSGMLQVNSGNTVDYADFPSTTRRTYSDNDNDNKNLSNIASVSGTLTGPQAAAAAAWFPGGTFPFAVTTSSPHNFKTGHVAQFLDNDHAHNPMILHLHDGSIWGLGFSTLTALVPDPIGSPDVFLCALPNTTAIDSFTIGSGGVVYHQQDGSAPEHCVELANQIAAAQGYGITLHLNVPQQVDADAGPTHCCDQLFAMIAANLASNCKLKVELSNEPWNFNIPYTVQHNYFIALGNSATQTGDVLTGTQAYVEKSHAVYQRAVAMFVAAGRPASDVIWLINTISVAQSFLTEICSYCTSKGYTGADAPNEIARSAYYGTTTDLQLFGDLSFATPEHGAAFAEANLIGASAFDFQTFAGYFRGSPNFFTTTTAAAYEFGLQALGVPVGSDADKIWRAQGASFHPRAYAIFLDLIQGVQDGGASSAAIASFSGSLSNDISPAGTGNYGFYAGWAMSAGIGDGSDGQADNRPIIADAVPGSVGYDYGSMCTPRGGAASTFMALVAGGVGNPPTLTLAPSSQSVVSGNPASLIATLANSTAALAATVDHGTLSTATPTSGVTFTVTPAANFAGAITVTVTDATDSLTQTAAVNANAPAPAITSPTVANLTGSTATLGATINPKSFDTTYHIEYGTTTSYGSRVPGSDADISNGSSGVVVTQNVTGLTPGATYHWRVVAVNSGGTTSEPDQSFVAPLLPTISNSAASAISTTTATFGGQVNPNGTDTTWHVEYGTTTAYGSRSPGTDSDAGHDGAPVPAFRDLTGLTAGTTYHARIVATSAAGVTDGPDTIFTTLSADLPTIANQAESAVTQTTATLSADVNPNGVDTTVYFKYGTTTSYGTNSPVTPEDISNGTDPINTSTGIAGLKQGTVYHWRTVAVSSAGTVTGPDTMFITHAATATSSGAGGMDVGGIAI